MTTAKLVLDGRLSQVCPRCGLIEAAGSYCSACKQLTGPTAWLVDSRHITRGADKASQRPAAPDSSADVQSPGSGALDTQMFSARVEEVHS